MDSFLILTLSILVISVVNADTVLSKVLAPKEDAKDKLSRQSRSYYYDPRYGTGRPYGRLEYDRLEDRPSRCGRCLDDRDDRDDDYDRRRGYDDDRRPHRPTYGNRFDRNKGDDDDDRHYGTDRNSNTKKNGTDDAGDKDKNRYDDKDNRPSGGRRDRDRDRNRDRYDDRDRYRPDYYDRFLNRDRDRYDRDRPYYDERRPLYDRYDDPYDRYPRPGYRRPYDDRYDRVAYDDGYGGYGPGVGRGPHDSFRPWDETYRGQAGWDAGGRGYYFASGRPDAAAAPSQPWGRPEYARPQYSESGWQNAGYGATGYRDPLEYRGTLGYGDGGYRQDLSAGYGQPSSGYGQSGWRNVGERRPYRDQSGVTQLDNRGNYNQPPRQVYGQPSRPPAYSQNYSQQSQGNGYSNANSVNSAYSNPSFSSTTTPNTNYLFQREDERVTNKVSDETTKPPQT